MEHNSHSSKETVLAKIREKSVHMRPKLFFTFETILAGLVAVVILVVSIALVNFILFGLRLNGHESLLGFGPRGLLAFFVVFPWPLLILDVLLVLFLETLLRRFKFGYRSPVLYLLLALLALATSAGLALDRGTSVNDRLLYQADHGGLPSPFGEIYEHMRVPAPHDRGIFRGTITEIGTSTIRMQHDDLDTDQDESGYIVILPSNFDITQFSAGEKVYVAGDMDDGTSTIRAFGVHPLPMSGEILLPPQP